MKRFAVLATTIVLLLLSSFPAYADSPAPQTDYIIEVGDGQFVFVMLVIPDDKGEYGYGEAILDEEIRAKYSKSGLYSVDDSNDALWTIDWYSYGVSITSDGKHLVRWGPWPLIGDYGEIAIQFYENGNLLISYRVFDLVSEPRKLPRSISHYEWLAAAEFDEEKKELFLETENGEEYLFDVTTGRVIEGTLSQNGSDIAEDQEGSWDFPLTYYLLGLCLCISVIIVIIIVGGIFLWKKSNQSD